MNCNWPFTYNNPEREWATAREEMGVKGKVNGIIWVPQRAPSGTPHLQGFLQTKVPVRMATAKKLLGCDRAHMEVMRGSVQQCIDYIVNDEKKTNTGDVVRIGEFDLESKGIERKTSYAEKLRDIMKKCQEPGTSLFSLSCEYPVEFGRGYKGLMILHLAMRDAFMPYPILSAPQPWMKDYLEDKTAYFLNTVLFTNEYKYRRIVWLWSMKGATGKTTYLKWFHNKAVEEKKVSVYMDSDRHVDMAHVIGRDTEFIFINVGRNVEPCWSFIESCRDGTIMSGKYESTVKRLMNPRIVIASNQPPDYRRISEEGVEELNLEEPSVRDIRPAAAPAEEKEEKR